MKAKTTLILAVVFLGLLAVILFVDRKKPEDAAAPEGKLVELASENVERITFDNGTETVTLAKNGSGEWGIVGPIKTPADTIEVSGFLNAFADLPIDRIVEKENADLKKYGIPSRDVTLKLQGTDRPVKISIGAENAVGRTFFAQKEGDPRVVLLPATLKSSLDKTLFDFRRKDDFRFETSNVTRIRLASPDVRWEARKTGGEWFLESPVKALAGEAKITALLETLSGLRAAAFAAETKNPEELKKTGLDRPETTVALSVSGAKEDHVFSFHRGADKTYVLSSESPRIIVPESDPLSELGKKPDEFRENRVAVFHPWEAVKLTVKKEGLSLNLAKGPDGKWMFGAGPKDEADGAKVEAFLGTGRASG
ncbi:MAG: DUF4340 domain-containing protein [Candidatus Aminicenantes bacterium]|nr:DUF4340 domain-containing protein [Candidatus Aminicenantes bacterium]